jgi:hypothetical protein
MPGRASAHRRRRFGGHNLGDGPDANREPLAVVLMRPPQRQVGGQGLRGHFWSCPSPRRRFSASADRPAAGGDLYLTPS